MNPIILFRLARKCYFLPRSDDPDGELRKTAYMLRVSIICHLSGFLLIVGLFSIFAWGPSKCLQKSLDRYSEAKLSGLFGITSPIWWLILLTVLLGYNIFQSWMMHKSPEGEVIIKFFKEKMVTCTAQPKQHPTNL